MNMSEKTLLIEEMFRLNQIDSSDKVAILTTHEFNQEELSAYRIALARLNTEFVHIILPPKAKGSKQVVPGSPMLFDILKHVTFIVTPSSSCTGSLPGIHAPEILNVLLNGVRMLQVQYSLEKIRQMWPTDDLIARTIAGAKIMEEAEIIKIVSGNGTAELIMNKRGRPAHTQYGIADKPGRWDNFACGCVSSTPEETSANGTLIVEPPAAISTLVRFVQAPIKLTIEDGYIIKIEGGLEARLLQKWMDQWEDQESYGTSHVGWGTHKRAGIGEGGGKANLISYLHNAYGTLLIAFGDGNHPSTAQFSGGGGKRISKSHCDIGGWNVDFYLDDVLICRQGKIVDNRCA